jgi:DNA-binding HxlR family transcriptional regulator
MGSKELILCINSYQGNGLMKLLGSRGMMDVLCVFCCSNKAVRFTQLNTMLPRLSPKTLASRLRELEGQGILRRVAYNEIPPRVEYSMTEKGQKLAEALMPLINWVASYSDGSI